MTAGQEATPSRDVLIEELAHTESQADREQILAKSPALVAADVVTELAAKVVERVRVDTHQARALAESALLIANKLGGKEELAAGMRAKANALYASGDHKE